MQSNARSTSGRRGELQPRVYAAIVALACLTLLAFGAGLAPNTAGHGTHTQLGLPPCAFAAVLGKPCATCGMTTAVSTAASGNLPKALAVQPFGAGLAVAAASAFWISVYSAATGSRVWKAATPLLRPKPMLIIAGLLLASWLYKIIVWNP
jgi:hypothetical protein